MIRATRTRPAGKLVRLTLVSVSGKPARTCYDKANRVDESVPANRIRLLFSYSKADQWTSFQDKLTKALKKLIVLSGGAPEKSTSSRESRSLLGVNRNTRRLSH